MMRIAVLCMACTAYRQAGQTIEREDGYVF